MKKITMLTFTFLIVLGLSGCINESQPPTITPVPANLITPTPQATSTPMPMN